MPAMERSEDDLIASMESKTLPPGAFTHAEHVRLAWTCLNRFPLLRAMAEFRRLLMGFAAHIGQPGLYHETVTFAYLLLVYERMSREPTRASWTEFVQRNSDLLSWKSGPLFDFYDSVIVTDRMARFCFVLPDPGPGERVAPSRPEAG